jgi:hypothetical protein
LTLTLGNKMLRVEDGMRGEVRAVPGLLDEVLRIVWNDRGEDRIASPKEVWIEDEQERLPLREEEIQEVAAVADHWLKCIEQHLPRFAQMAPFQIGERIIPPHDAGLVAVIIEYLRGRA